MSDWEVTALGGSHCSGNRREVIVFGNRREVTVFGNRGEIIALGTEGNSLLWEQDSFTVERNLFLFSFLVINSLDVNLMVGGGTHNKLKLSQTLFWKQKNGSI